MTGNGERLGEEVGHVVQAAVKEDTEVSPADPVSNPVQAHVRLPWTSAGKRCRQRCRWLPRRRKTAGWGAEGWWPMLAKIFSLFSGDAGGGVEARVLRFHYKGTNNNQGCE